MAKGKNPKAKQPKTFVQRVTAWTRGNLSKGRADVTRDKDLVAAARASWQSFSNARPRTASLTLSGVITLHQIYELGEIFNGSSGNPALDIVDTLALEEHLKVDQLADGIVKALLGPAIDSDKGVTPTGVKAKAILNVVFGDGDDPRETALKAIAGVGLDNATVCLGMVLMLNGVREHGRTFAYGELADVLGATRYLIEKTGKETT